MDWGNLFTGAGGIAVGAVGKKAWEFGAQWVGRKNPKPRVIEVIPERFRVTLNKSVPEIDVHVRVVNYSDKPIHLSSMKIPWLQFASAQTVKDIVGTHYDIPPRSSKGITFGKELSDAYIGELKKLIPPYGVMAAYENAQVTIEYEGTIGKRNLAHQVVNNLKIPTGEVAGLPYVLIKEANLRRRFKLASGVRSPAEWILEGVFYAGEIMHQSLDQGQIIVYILKPDGSGLAVYVPLSQLVIEK